MIDLGHKCKESNDDIDMGKVAELTECAELCRNVSSSESFFMYGSMDNPQPPVGPKEPDPIHRCDDGEEKCECICKTSKGCNIMKDAGYDLYQFGQNHNSKKPCKSSI